MFRSTATPLSSIARSRNWVGDRHGAGLGGDAEHEDVERRRAAEQPIRDVGRVEPAVQLAPRHPIEPLAQGIEGRERGGGMGDHLAGRNGVGVGDDDGAVGRGAAPVRVACRGQQVEREEHVDTRHAGVVRRRRHLVGDADVARDGSGLLREAGLVEAPHGVAGQHRRRAEDLADGDDARAADAREADGEPGGIDDRRRLREIADVDLAGRRAGALLTGGVSRHRGERRAVALHAREVEVAARLVDAGLATERSVDRLHGEAVALGAAVATALADPFVDDDPEVGGGELAATTGTSVLGRARLVVDQHRRARDRGEHLLRFVETGAVPHVDALGELVVVVAVEVVGGDDHLADAFEQHHLRDLRHADSADGVLAAGHRDRAVVEQLVRDVDARRDRGADRQ